MTQTTVTCDRCRSPIDQGRTRLVVEGSASPAPPWPADPVSQRPVLDLCGPCLSALGAWLAGPKAEAG